MAGRGKPRCNGAPFQGNCGGSPPATAPSKGGQNAPQPPRLGGPRSQPRLGHVGLRVPLAVPGLRRHLTLDDLRRHIAERSLAPSDRGLVGVEIELLTYPAADPARRAPVGALRGKAGTRLPAGSRITLEGNSRFRLLFANPAATGPRPCPSRCRRRLRRRLGRPAGRRRRAGGPGPRHAPGAAADPRPAPLRRHGGLLRRRGVRRPHDDVLHGLRPGQCRDRAAGRGRRPLAPRPCRRTSAGGDVRPFPGARRWRTGAALGPPAGVVGDGPVADGTGPSQSSPAEPGRGVAGLRPPGPRDDDPGHRRPLRGRRRPARRRGLHVRRLDAEGP